MLVTQQTRGEKAQTVDSEACLAEVERLVRSPLLSSSEALCKLLQFLAHHTLHSPAEHVREYEIATQVFGRPADFDPQSDSSVRVQIGRLRTKLAEYYQTSGADDPIVVDVPKGSYALSFRRQVVAAVANPREGRTQAPAGSLIGSRTSLRFAAITLILALVTIGLLIALFRRVPAPSAAASSPVAQTGSPSLRTFWEPFLQGSEAPFVVFSNAQFVGNPVTGMRYYDSARDSRDKVSQRYTGIGEVIGVEELEGLFLRTGRQFQIKRSGLFTLDDARNNLIFVGSPTENLTLGEIPHHSGFVFQRLRTGQEDQVQGIVDLQPGPGESSQYLPTPESRPMEVDYAVITLTHGLDPARWTLILAGASTIGTQAAVDFACNADSVKDLLHRLDIPPGAGMKPFEALLRIRVANDVPLTTELVKVRRTE